MSMSLLYFFGIYATVGVFIALFYHRKLKRLPPVLAPMTETYLKINKWFGVGFAITCTLAALMLCWVFRVEWDFV